MSNWKPYSKRQAREDQGNRPEPYVYTEIPEAFRNQVIHILDGCIGVESPYGGLTLFAVVSPSRAPAVKEMAPREVWQVINQQVAIEAGKLELSPASSSRRERFQAYFRDPSLPAEEVLDAIEIAFRVLVALDHVSDKYRQEHDVWLSPNDAVEQLNRRLGEHNLGYRFESGQILKLTSEYSHSEIVEPALRLLQTSGFEGPVEEFLDAHKHFRQGEYRDAIADASNAFESTMKTICDKAGWQVPENATAAPLIDALIRNDLLPKELESHYKGLISAMKSGLPTLSNRKGRHGQGATPVAIPEYLAAYAIHLAAANILFLVDSWTRKVNGS